MSRFTRTLVSVCLVFTAWGCLAHPEVEPTPPPSISSIQPETGPYGTEIALSGERLGSASEPEALLLLGGSEEQSFRADDDSVVVSWSMTEIRFRYPFPADGVVEVENKRGSVIAGEFTPDWAPGIPWAASPAVTALSSLSPEPGHIVVLLDFAPAVLLDFGPDNVAESHLELGAVDPASVRLYLNADGQVEAVGVRSDPEPEIIHFRADGAGLEAAPSGVLLEASDYLVAGGQQGAAVWMLREDGWYRARPADNGWAIDAGPIADPRPSRPHRSAAATADGALFVAWSEDVGGWLDDMGAPYMRRYPPDGDAFEAETRAGIAVDDFLTSLQLEGIGPGVIVNYCGSDVDPFGTTADAYRCYISAHTVESSSGTHSTTEASEDETVYAFSRSLIARGKCEGSYLALYAAFGSEDSEHVIFPCPRIIALAIDGRGELLPVVLYQSNLYSPRRRS